MALYIICAVLLFTSVIANFRKTKEALKKAVELFLNILPSFLIVILIAVIILYFFAPQDIVKILSKGSPEMNIIIACIIGSVLIMPGYIAFPLAKILKAIGISYGVLAGLTTSLMMVGGLTLTIEKKYFGLKIAVFRNIISFVIALITSFVIGVVL